MSSTSETGHAKNVANANLFNSYAANLGIIYNPSNPDLGLKNLQALYSEAFAQQEQINAALPPYTFAVNARQAVFSTINKDLTKLQKAYKATKGVSGAQMEDFMTIARKIKGLRKSPLAPPIPPETEATNYSVSQLSYDQRTNHFSELIQLLQTTPDYAPNETEYQITTLQTEKDQMMQTTQEVADTYFPLSQARSGRNKTMYTNENNLIDTYNTAKTYIFTILDKNSPEYKAFAKLKFKRIES